MAASLGENLRLAREARGISLREISEQTRISTRYLEAIEADDYKRLPGGIFNKSFIRAYAKYIGYDEREALEGYQRTAREQGASPDEIATTPYQSRVYTDGSGNRSPFITLLLTILILAILSLGVYAGLHWYQRRTQAPEVNHNAAPAQATQSANPNVGPANNGAPAANTSAATLNNAASGLNIQVKAVRDDAWIRTSLDDEKRTEKILKADETLEFKPAQQLRLEYAKVKAKSLEVTINGRPARVTSDSKGSLAEMLITKENYEQLLQ